MASLSILIPVYNCHCLELVRSLLRQEGLKAADEWEIVVADDGSDADTFPISNRAIATLPHCRYIERPVNVGRAAIRNFLAAEAQYERLVFIDGDMALRSPDFIANYLKAAPEAVVYGGYEVDGWHPDNLRWLYEWKSAPHHAASVRQRHPYHDFHTSNYCIPRSIAVGCQLETSYSGYGYEDVAYGKRLSELSIPIVHIANPVVFCDFESNGAYLDKIDESIRSLWAHRMQLAHYSRLIALCRRLHSWRVDGVLVALFRRYGQRLRRRIERHPSLAWLKVYKICSYLSVQAEAEQGL